MVDSVDKNGDGLVDYEEFVSLMEQETRKVQGEELQRYFHVFDAEGKGHITAERLRRTLTEMGEPTTLAEAEAMIKFADLNADGVVTVEEFIECFEKIA